jgi:hypothetical protein
MESQMPELAKDLIEARMMLIALFREEAAAINALTEMADKDCDTADLEAATASLEHIGEAIEQLQARIKRMSTPP